MNKPCGTIPVARYLPWMLLGGGIGAVSLGLPVCVRWALLPYAHWISCSPDSIPEVMRDDFLKTMLPGAASGLLQGWMLVRWFGQGSSRSAKTRSLLRWALVSLSIAAIISVVYSFKDSWMELYGDVPPGFKNPYFASMLREVSIFHFLEEFPSIALAAALLQSFLLGFHIIRRRR